MRKRVSLVVVCLLLIAAIVGCSKPAPAPTTAPAPKPTTAAPAPAPSTKAPPATTAAPTPKPAPSTSAPAPAAPALNYKGKLITLAVGTAVGGGGDVWTRLLALYLPKYIPGNPTVIVRDMPGGEGLEGGNFAWNAKPDGLVIGSFSGKQNFHTIFRPKGIQFDYAQMTPIYAQSAGTVAFAKTGLGITKPEDIMKGKEAGLIWGFSDPVSGSGALYVWGKELLGFEVKKEIWGYGGSGPAFVGFLSGENNFSCQGTAGFNTSVRPYVTKGEVLPIFSTGLLDANGKCVREAGAKDVPTVPEVYKMIKGTDPPPSPALDAYYVGLSTDTFSKSLVLPPNAPPDVVKVMQQACADMAKDPEYNKRNQAMTPDSPHLVLGDLKGFNAAFTVKADVKKYMKDIYVSKYNAALD